MTNNRKLTKEEIDERRASLDAFQKERRAKLDADPKHVRVRDWLMTAFKGNALDISDYAASAITDMSQVLAENEELVKTLNHMALILRMLNDDKLPSHVRVNLAALVQDIDSTEDAENPISASKIGAVFEAGGRIAKQVEACRNAEKRHGENYAMKAQVLAWCDAHADRFMSTESIARLIAGKIVPITQRTAVTWIAQWKKQASAVGK